MLKGFPMIEHVRYRSWTRYLTPSPVFFLQFLANFKENVLCLPCASDSSPLDRSSTPNLFIISPSLMDERKKINNFNTGGLLYVKHHVAKWLRSKQRNRMGASQKKIQKFLRIGSTQLSEGPHSSTSPSTETLQRERWVNIILRNFTTYTQFRVWLSKPGQSCSQFHYLKTPALNSSSSNHSLKKLLEFAMILNSLLGEDLKRKSRSIIKTQS